MNIDSIIWLSWWDKLNGRTLLIPLTVWGKCPGIAKKSTFSSDRLSLCSHIQMVAHFTKAQHTANVNWSNVETPHLILAPLFKNRNNKKDGFTDRKNLNGHAMCLSWEKRGFFTFPGIYLALSRVSTAGSCVNWFRQQTIWPKMLGYRMF